MVGRVVVKALLGGGGTTGVKGWEPKIMAELEPGAAANWYLMGELAEGGSGTSPVTVDILSGNSAVYSDPLGPNVTIGQPGIIPGSPFYSAKLVDAYAWQDILGPSGGYSLAAPYVLFAVFATVTSPSLPMGIAGMGDTSGLGSNGTRSALYLGSGGALVGGQDTAGGAFNTVAGTTDLADGNPHFVAIVYDGISELALYEDGLPVGSVNPGTPPADLTFPIIGYATAGFDGAGTIWKADCYLQSVAYFQAEVDAAQIAAIYAAGKFT